MQAGLSYFDKKTPALVIRSLFDQYDKNKNGTLEENEMKILLEQDMGLEPEQSNIYQLLVDKDGDHVVTFEEFLSWLRSGERFESISDQSKLQRLRDAVGFFKEYDLDDDNTLDKEEFGNLLKSLGHKDAAERDETFHRLDQFNRGKVSFWEFVKWLNWTPIRI